MNNELIKQRLSCIPIFINDLKTPIDNYQVIINKQNTSDNIEFITTEDIDIIDKKLNKSLDINLIRNIFPKNSFTNDFIDIVRLRPSLSKESEGEQLILSADLSIGTAKENGAYNVVSTCSYGNTPNIPIIEEKISKLILEYESKNLDQKKIDFLIKDWRLLNEEMKEIDDLKGINDDEFALLEERKLMLYFLRPKAASSWNQVIPAGARADQKKPPHVGTWIGNQSNHGNALDDQIYDSPTII